MHAQSHIRNFCIIAHIDHGKSTLADRFLELTNTIEKRDMQSQLLDTMELERERGITIKLQPVRMHYTYNNEPYIINLIDTPGHVDFTYEVSRSLAAVEGAVLLVDATQGVQAQTIANLYLALEQDLTIIPVINKIDLPAADVERASQEIIELIGCKKEDILLASGKTGLGVKEILNAVIERVSAPKGNDHAPLRALIFDSYYDEFRGVVASVRIIDGEVHKKTRLHYFKTNTSNTPVDVGIFTPKYKTIESLHAGEIGMIATGLKDLKSCRVGDTIMIDGNTASPLPGYNEIKPMVFAGIFPDEGDEYTRLRDALEKLALSDSSLSFETEQSDALGHGFRCGFLGLLHLEIVQERIRREHNLDIVVTVPSVAYRVTMKNGEEMIAKSPQKMPERNFVEIVEEPWVKLDVITSESTIGGIMQFVQDKRGIYKTTEYVSSNTSVKRVIIHYEIPLAAILTDFYDGIKSISSGYASMNYEPLGYRETNVVKVDIYVAEEKVEALSTLVWEDSAERVGRKIAETLKDTLPQQQFVLKIQAMIGGKIIAAERLSALRKDVTAKLYGGDVTRKRKLLEKQKKGKKRMLEHATVDIPPSAYLAVLKR